MKLRIICIVVVASSVTWRPNIVSSQSETGRKYRPDGLHLWTISNNLFLEKFKFKVLRWLYCYLFTGLPMGKPSRGLRLVCLFSFFFFFLVFFFSVSVKVLPVTPLVSGVFVHRAFCAYFLRIERVVELRRFLWWTQ